MKVDYLSEFGFRLSDYGKCSTIVLFLPPTPCLPLGRAPGRCRCRCPRRGAELSLPRPPYRSPRPLRRRGPAAVGRFPGTLRPAPPLPPPRNFSRCRGGRGAVRGAPGPGRVGRGGGTRCCCRSLGDSFTFLSLVSRKLASAPAAAPAPLSPIPVR